MFTSVDELVEFAVNQKQQRDELALLGDKLYVCLECGVVTDYWKPGEVCAACEWNGERQQEMDKGN